MAAERQDAYQRGDPRRRLERDLARRQRGLHGQRFLTALALIGSVGWPIALLGTGGALLGRYLDGRLGTGIRLTLTLLTLGVSLGATAAWQALRRSS